MNNEATSRGYEDDTLIHQLKYTDPRWAITFTTGLLLQLIGIYLSILSRCEWYQTRSTLPSFQQNLHSQAYTLHDTKAPSYLFNLWKMNGGVTFCGECKIICLSLTKDTNLTELKLMALGRWVNYMPKSRVHKDGNIYLLSQLVTASCHKNIPYPKA